MTEPSLRPEQITPPIAEHGEGPMWDTSARALRWVDMLRGDVLTLEGTGRVHREHVSEVAAALRPRRQGGFVVAVERGFLLIDEYGAIGPVHRAFDDATVRMNDGGCDPAGRFFCGSMAYDMAPGRGALYCFDPDGQVTTVLDNVTISNGIAWDSDGTRVFYVDSATGRVDTFEYDLDTTTFRDRRPLVVVPPEQGMPDGIALDTEGGIWVALWGGSAVHRYTVDGALDAVVHFPATQVTACAFGGPDMSDLYVTTSQIETRRGEQPAAGALFRLSPGISGREVGDYAG